MKRALLVILALLSSSFSLNPAHAGSSLHRVQDSGNPFAGTWRSGNFAFTFYDDGRYVYVGMMGNNMMSSQIAEQGTYRISGDSLVVTRSQGVVSTSQNYRRDLPVETTVYHWQLENMYGRAALLLVFPTGGKQVFYKD